MTLYSKHAREKMIERGISVNEVEEALRSGAKEMQEEKVLHHYRYFTIVTKLLNNEQYVITVKPRW